MTYSHNHMVKVKIIRTPLFRDTNGRRERRKGETRMRIFRAAMKLFAQQGFAETTVEQITEEADVGKGTFFNYFASKEELLFTLSEVQESKLRSLLPIIRDAKTVRPVLKQFMHDIVAEPSRTPTLSRSLLGTALSTPPMVARMGEVMRFGQRVVSQVMKRGQELREIRRDLPAEELARMFQQTTLGTHVLWALLAPGDLSYWLDQIFEVFWRGIALVPRKQRAPRARQARAPVEIAGEVEN